MTDLGLIVGLETMEGHDEAGDASRIVDRLYPHYPGVLGSIADGAYRGKHRRHHYQHGKQLICPQNSAPRDSEGAEAAPKLSFIEGVEITLSATGQPHRLEIYSKGGQVGVGTMAVNGEFVFTPARIIDVESKRNKDGGWRWYAKFRLPSGGPYQAETFTLRIDGEDRPERERVNPAEAVHIVAKDDPPLRAHPRPPAAGGVGEQPVQGADGLPPPLAHLQSSASALRRAGLRRALQLDGALAAPPVAASTARAGRPASRLRALSA